MSLNFQISEDVIKKIDQWDRCMPVDVTGAKFAYTFVPSSLGTYIMVKCDVCKRELHVSEEFDL